MVMIYFLHAKTLRKSLSRRVSLYIYYPIKALICSTLCDESQTTRTSPLRATNKPGTVGILYFARKAANTSLALSSELMKYISFPNASRTSLIFGAKRRQYGQVGRPTKRTTSFPSLITLLLSQLLFPQIGLLLFQIVP